MAQGDGVDRACIRCILRFNDINSAPVEGVAAQRLISGDKFVGSAGKEAFAMGAEAGLQSPNPAISAAPS